MADRRPARSRPRLVIACALLFFFGPALAFLGGVRAHPFENHKLAPFPQAGDGWDAFGRFSSWTTDHLPLREQAVKADGRISRDLFDEEPAFTGGGASMPAGVPDTATTTHDAQGSTDQTFPKVIVGRNGWLYFGADTANACRPQLPLDTVVQRLDRIGAAVTASGRRFVLVVAPDKSGMVPENLPGQYPGRDCAQAARSAFWARMAVAPPPGWLDVRTPLLVAQQTSGHPWYRMHDTHWDEDAAALYGDRLAHTLDPGLAGSLRQDGTVTHEGDLGVLLGQPHKDTFDKLVLDRPGVTTVTQPGADADIPLIHATSVSSGAGLIPGKTVMLYDSFTDAAQQYVTPWFSDLTLIHNQAPDKDPAVVARDLADSDTVVIEVVERSLATGYSASLQERFVAQLEQQLRDHPHAGPSPVGR